jgi:hypothetical protein
MADTDTQIVAGFRNRTLTPGQHVRVHYNPKKGHYTITDPNTRATLAHLPTVAITEAKFRVYETGRKQTKATKKPVAHAFVIGRFAGTEPIETDSLRPSAYNPYFNRTFIDKESKTPLTGIYPVVVGEGNTFRYREAQTVNP